MRRTLAARLTAPLAALLALTAGTLPAPALDLAALHAFVFQATRVEGGPLRLVVGVVNGTHRALRSVSVDCRLLDAGQATLLTRTLLVRDVLAVGTTYGQADIDLAAAPGYAGVACAVTGAEERSSSSRAVPPDSTSAGGDLSGRGWMAGA